MRSAENDRGDGGLLSIAEGAKGESINAMNQRCWDVRLQLPLVDAETGAVMSLVRFGDPMGPLSKASLPS